MKKIYILFNYDVNEVILATEDKELAQECMYDCFIADVEYQWYWEQQKSNIGDTYTEKCETAKGIWYDMMNWYDNYIDIIESEVI